MAESRVWQVMFFIALSAVLCLTPLPSDGDSGEKLTLDAEELVFDESTGIAKAEGGASLVYGDVRMYAPVLEMNTETNRVLASSKGSEGQYVTVFSGGRALKGSWAEFDLSSQEGTIYGADVSLPLEDSDQAVFIKGDKVEVASAASARTKNWLPKRFKKISDDESVGRFENVSVTTCSLPHPHYRLKARRLVLIPDQEVIIKSPQVYLGEKLLFTYPFDYPVSLKDRSRNRVSFMPNIVYDSDKGVGLGFSGPFIWNGGSLTLSVTEWSKEDLEWRGRIDQELLPWLKIYGETVWEYESSSDSKSYRPLWGLDARSRGWILSGRWSEREAIKKELVSGSAYKGSLWRSPEIELKSPWYSMSDDGPLREYIRVSAVWGRYEDTGSPLPMTERFGWTGEVYGTIDGPIGSVKPFWRVKYTDYRYDVTGEDRQKITDAAIGLTYRNPSGLELGTAYSRRWVEGKSAFTSHVTSDTDSWDDYDEEELIYQKVAFGLSDKLRLELIGAYELNKETLDEMVYKISYDNRCCYGWSFTYRDDRSGGDSWAGLTFSLRAFPDRPAEFGGEDLQNPFTEPEGLPK